MVFVTYVIYLLKEYFRQGSPCLFRSLTGLYCPGCGGTRALRFLLKGDVMKSLWYHPLVGYMAAVMAAEFGGWVIRRWRRGRRGDGGITEKGTGMTEDEKACSCAEDRERSDKGNRQAGRAGFLGHYEAEVYVGIGIAAVNWAVKNWVLLRWGVELIS